MTKTNSKHIIWSNFVDLEDYEDYFKEIEEDGKTLTDNEKLDMVYDMLEDYIQDERANLDIQLEDEILVIGTIGLWNGTIRGYKIIKNGNIADCLCDNCDYCEWYVDRYNLCFDGAHHDGTNSYIYRTWKENLSDKQKDNFLDKLYYGKATSKDITRYTKSLKPIVCKVYGW